ncbi:hypothetical protein GTW51_14200 [Aurantimonas aggregata]|uniref:Transmembrane protein n=1 Tax=Aurantimonas aggregata TaxID=2047720 RepID=A0A6L9MJB6_9HYPH|nr:hypothetical protein [Aurantimonas aggregata]NDV87855.1 hypothetical protein [Aurantimonas aggregata]
MPSDAILATALAWWGELQVAAFAHPVVATIGLTLVLLSLLLSRSLTILVAATFLAIAAVFGSEPVTDPLKRLVFAAGCFAVILVVSLTAMTLRLRLRDARATARQSSAEAAEWRRLYEQEAASHDSADVAPASARSTLPDA